jgi:hypothetical protein
MKQQCQLGSLDVLMSSRLLSGNDRCFREKFFRKEKTEVSWLRHCVSPVLGQFAGSFAATVINTIAPN